MHEPAGIVHCLECLQLDGCWFTWDNAPLFPQHKKCHCRLEATDYLVVLMNVSTYSDYRKFDPYLFDPNNFYKHGKNKAFESWGYSVDDAKWLQDEMERQAVQLKIYSENNMTLRSWNRNSQSLRVITTMQGQDSR